MDAYAEVVVNRPIIRHQRVTRDDETTYVEPQELTETRLKTFTYHIPPQLQGLLQVGQLVAVPFRKQLLQGIVVGLSEQSNIEQTRPIEALLDPIPVLTPKQVALAAWLAESYLAPLTTCLNLFLPPGSNRQPVTVVELIPDAPLPTDLTPLERALQLYLQQQKTATSVDDLEPDVVSSLVRKGLVRKRTTLTKPSVGPRIERTVELLISPEEIEEAVLDLGRPSKQAAILRYMAALDDPLPTIESVCQAVGCSASPIKALLDRGWLEHHASQTLAALPPQVEPLEWTALKDDQQAALSILRTTGIPQPLTTLEIANQSLHELVDHAQVVLLTEPDRIALSIPLDEIPAAIVKLRGTERHLAVLNLLAAEEDPVWIGWVYAQTEANAKTLKDLAAADLIAFDEARRWRDPLAERTFTINTPPVLTDEQRDILITIYQTLNRHHLPHLLHGVTGSGKTEIYLRAMQMVLERGRGVIFLVPEVMLATQIVERVQARFPGRVALWHSSLSPGERYDTWERVRSGELTIVVGPRSALFAPLQNPGLIIIDEEHEPAYKQQLMSPTYHTREAAIEYGRLTDIPVIMGSATPDVVTYRRAQRGEFMLHHLPNRILAHKKHLAVQAMMLRRQQRQQAVVGAVGSVATAPSEAFITLPMPPVEIVDLREELRAGNRSIFSRPLAAAIESTLAAGEQVILFLNRRGTATFVICRDCGYVMHCPQCDTTLTYHATNEMMACHYCGYHTQMLSTCPSCQSERIRYFGLGTERVEEMLRQSFPDARPIRFDRDTTRKAGSHYAYLQAFVEGRANVMIGTQMVAKGLDLPLVTLVGVISADTALYLPDFLAAERTFQVLMQVAGRAGRSPLGGRVILQTYTPEQPAILAASEHDYTGFYQEELRFRYEQGYPPFKRMARLSYTGGGQERSFQMAEEIARRLRLWVAQQGFPAVDIVGPAPAYVQRVRSKYRWQIIVRAPDPAKVLGPVPLPPGCRIDIDPVNLL